jgi:YD repeat-containing protein
LGNVSIVSFDDLGLKKVTWDGLDRHTTFSHSISKNLLTKITSPEGLVTRFQYDERGNQARTVNPMGHEQQLEYEPAFNSLAH